MNQDYVTVQFHTGTPSCVLHYRVDGKGLQPSVLKEAVAAFIESQLTSSTHLRGEWEISVDASGAFDGEFKAVKA